MRMNHKWVFLEKIDHADPKDDNKDYVFYCQYCLETAYLDNLYELYNMTGMCEFKEKEGEDDIQA